MPTFGSFAGSAKVRAARKRRLSKILAEEIPKTIEEIVAEQGKGPVNYDDLLKRGEFWPKDENVDDFIEFVRETRKDDPFKRLSRSD